MNSISSLHGAFAQGRPEPVIVTIFKEWSRLTTDLQGEMNRSSLHGLIIAETQFISNYRIQINGKPLVHRFTVQTSGNSWSLVGVVNDGKNSAGKNKGARPRGSIEVRLNRVLDQGLNEKILIKNHGSLPRQVKAVFYIACPIEDGEFAEEKKKNRLFRKSGIIPQVVKTPSSLSLKFNRVFGARRNSPTEEMRGLLGDRTFRDGEKIERGLELTIGVTPESAPTRIRALRGRENKIIIRAKLPPRGKTEVHFFYDAIIDGYRMNAPRQTDNDLFPTEKGTIPETWARFDSANSSFNLTLGQALSDLWELRSHPFDFGRGAGRKDLQGYIAGVPRYLGTFGRDTIITARQAALFNWTGMEQALNRIAVYQGVKIDPWRDEEPGRMPHEGRVNPRSCLGKMNRELYYGDVAATPLWMIGAAELYRWSGDLGQLSKNLPVIERCSEWLLRQLDLGDGFVFYQPMLPGHKGINRNQAWKDSDDAIVDREGRICVPPLALSEIQGYAYQALVEVARIFSLLKHPDRARHLHETAQALHKKFNERFWMPEENFYAFALQGDGRQIRSIASNPGHCLGTGIVPPDRAQLVTQRILKEDLFSGWGVRTLSTENPAYDPFSYHRGSVWPAENATIAAGMAHAGFHREANQIIEAQLTLATLFQHFRLPEVLSGCARTRSTPVPGLYPHANSLQSWSSSAICLFTQSILGVKPDAPHSTLTLDPHLPEWLPQMELRELRIGRHTADLKFWRDASTGLSHWKVVQASSGLRIVQERASTEDHRPQSVA